MKAPSSSIIALAALLALLNFIALSWISIEESRWARVLTAAVWFGVYFRYFSKRTLLLAGALLSFLIADIFTLSYHLDASKDGFFIFHGIAFSLLFLFITKGTIREQWSRFQKHYILISAGLSFALLLYFGYSFRSEIQGIRHSIFFYFHGLAIIACLITALSFYERKTDSYSMSYLVAALGLIFADLTAFPAEYLAADGFYYFSRTFYVAGLAGLVNFSFSSKPLPQGKSDTVSKAEVLEPKKATAYHEH